MKKRRISNFGYFIKEGVTSVFSHGFMSFASITIIVACLIIMGSFSLLAININELIRQVEGRNEVTAYVDEALTVEEARALESAVSSAYNVSYVEFVTKEEAWEDFISDYEQDYFTEMEATVLRDRYIVYMEDIALMRETKDALDGIEGIDKVSAYLELAKAFVTVRNVVSVVCITLVVILLVISIFIISNTIKLATFDRREEIAIMKMVGATNGFIRWPFVFQGFILGMTGACIAFFAQWGLYTLVADRIMGSIAGNIVTVVPFSTLSEYILAVFLGTGFVVGVLGSVFTIRNYLKV